MLRIAEPYITWGYPNLISVRELIYKHGMVKHNQRVPNSDNFVIERKLDKAHDIQCVDYLALLDSSSRKPRTYRGHYVGVGDFGNREDNINKLLRKMV
ncbi:PREDICTED: 60S ribosomal protein L7-like [Rhagoletis zephyria]|uniref:60S ribosomal protein L7-like n=1 Tax=Rhagoletis zephyria TaxID=28612 RepID=UPI000811A385|nr:PREDICTED: 60S ribosomal protein L7-like [Rhagoletis zephyria]